MKNFGACTILLAAVLFAEAARSAEPITLDNVGPPAAIAADEPRATGFSLDQAARSLDTAALDWQKNRACTACHTMLPYLVARPALSGVLPQAPEVRQFFEEVIAGKREAMPDYSCHDVEGAVAVGIAWSMALNDRATTGRLHPLTRRALDRMWALQRPAGDWEWPYRDSPPLKIDEHYGVTLAAIAAGMAPDDYGASPAGQAGLERIRKYLAKKRPVSLHQRAMTLWASIYVDRLLSADEKAAARDAILDVQRPDGGWSLGNLVDNSNDPELKSSVEGMKARSEEGYGSEFFLYVGRGTIYKSSAESDGYATGLVIFVARQAGLPIEDARLRRGITWLKENQRESGRWFTPSQAWHKQNLISNAGTAYAVLALAACGEVPVRRPAK
jgi:squalene-hopene/tetraprenyl-beta-curcumene cyclase